MKIFLALFFSLSLLLALKAYSLEKGKWSFVKTDEYCYIGSLPIETDLAPEKNRGDHYILVYKNIGNTETIVQLEAGYDYKIGPEIIFKIRLKYINKSLGILDRWLAVFLPFLKLPVTSKLDYHNLL